MTHLKVKVIYSAVHIVQQGSKFDHEYVDISLDGVIHDCDYFVDEDCKLQSCSSSRQNK